MMFVRSIVLLAMVPVCAGVHLGSHAMQQKDMWDGQLYHENSLNQYQVGRQSLDSYEFNGNESVLDVGCGTGRTTAEVAARVPNGRVVGIDVSLSMIEVAKKNYALIPNLSFILQDATMFKVDKAFDLIVSFFVVHWIHDQAAVFKNMYHALKRGGKIILRSSLRRGVIDQDLTIKKYVDLLTEAGFKNINVRIEQQVYEYASQQEFLDYLMTWVPASMGLQVDQALLRAQEVVQKIMRVQRNAEGLFKLQVPLVLIDATV